MYKENRVTMHLKNTFQFAPVKHMWLAYLHCWSLYNPQQMK